MIEKIMSYNQFKYIYGNSSNWNIAMFIPLSSENGVQRKIDAVRISFLGLHHSLFHWMRQGFDTLLCQKPFSF